MNRLWFRGVCGSLALVSIAVLPGASQSLAQSPVQEVGDEKEPAIRAELVRRGTAEQGIRAEFDRFRKDHGLFGLDNKAFNEKLDGDLELKRAMLAIAFRMMDSDKVNTLRMKQIVAKY